MEEFLASEADFICFYRANIDGLLAFFARRTLDTQVSVDLAAETFAQAFASRRTFRGSSEQEPAWLYTIAKRQLARYFEDGAVRRKLTQQLTDGVPLVSERDTELIENLAGLTALRSDLREVLQTLEESQRQALWLRVVEEEPYATVALRLNISEPAARKRVSRALRTLGERLPSTHATYEEGLA